MTTGQQQMPNNGVGTNSIHELCVWVSPTNGASFFPSHFQFQPFLFFHVQGRHAGGIWAEFHLRYAALGLKGASSISLRNSDMCLQSLAAATPPAPCCRDVCIFMLSGRDGIDGKFAEKLGILNKESVGLPGLSLTLSLKQNTRSMIFNNLRSFSDVRNQGGSVYKYIPTLLTSLHLRGRHGFQPGCLASSETQEERSETWLFQ